MWLRLVGVVLFVLPIAVMLGHSSGNGVESRGKPVPDNIVVSVSPNRTADLGEVPVGESRTTHFWLTNLSTVDSVLISEPKPNCTCLEADLGRQSLGPGDKTFVRVVHGANKMGLSSSRVTLIAKGQTGEQFISLEVNSTGIEASERLRLVKGVVDFGDVVNDTPIRFVLDLNTSGVGVNPEDVRVSSDADLDNVVVHGENLRLNLSLNDIATRPFGAVSVAVEVSVKGWDIAAAKGAIIGRKLPDKDSNWPPCFVILEKNGRIENVLTFPGVQFTGEFTSSEPSVKVDLDDSNKEIVTLGMGQLDALSHSADVDLASSIGDIRLRVVAMSSSASEGSVR